MKKNKNKTFNVKFKGKKYTIKDIAGPAEGYAHPTARARRLGLISAEMEFAT